MSIASDPGLAAVRFVHEHLRIEPEWSVWEERGFAWWGGRLAQRVWADRPFEEDGRTVCCVHAETDFVRSFPRDDAAFSLIGEAAGNAALSGFVRCKDGALRLWSGACVHKENFEWVSKVFSAAAALAAREAEASVDAMGRSLRAAPATSEHPASGRRAARHDVVSLVGALAGGGEPASRWNDQAELAEIGDTITGKAGCFPSIGPLSLRAEIPFGPHGGYDAPGGLSARLEVSMSARHPEIGSGVLLRIHLPFRLERHAQARLALDLNSLERTSYLRSHSLGSWCPHPWPGPAYVSFLPIGLYEKDVLLHLVISMIARAEWIARRYETSEELRARLSGS
ncbi:MAG: hypothetical protein ABIH26_05075 [Candidatus Eisenbacteria bacterium]